MCLFGSQQSLWIVTDSLYSPVQACTDICDSRDEEGVTTASFWHTRGWWGSNSIFVPILAAQLNQSLIADKGTLNSQMGTTPSSQMGMSIQHQGTLHHYWISALMPGQKCQKNRCWSSSSMPTIPGNAAPVINPTTLWVNFQKFLGKIRRMKSVGLIQAEWFWNALLYLEILEQKIVWYLVSVTTWFPGNIGIIFQENRSSPEAIDLIAYCRILNILREQKLCITKYNPSFSTTGFTNLIFW